MEQPGDGEIRKHRGELRPGDAEPLQHGEELQPGDGEPLEQGGELRAGDGEPLQHIGELCPGEGEPLEHGGELRPGDGEPLRHGGQLRPGDGVKENPGDGGGRGRAGVRKRSRKNVAKSGKHHYGLTDTEEGLVPKHVCLFTNKLKNNVPRKCPLFLLFFGKLVDALRELPSQSKAPTLRASAASGTITV
ncbi:hypothetical protein NDU88_003008 [Pleurodeles waltl]|uniref:Uncharacterized protein n=1 Tax=Pleurodeles waltl TaxID=8319 RepID=A0AAV7WQ91_PLEWA|nr:hypothetical protein NDU88_003008 [Pleurodeles waltl]